MVQIIFSGLMIPFAGTALGAALVLFMKKELGGSTTKILSGFAAGVMVAASIWSLLIPSIEQSSGMGRLFKSLYIAPFRVEINDEFLLFKRESMAYNPIFADSVQTSTVNIIGFLIITRGFNFTNDCFMLSMTCSF